MKYQPTQFVEKARRAGPTGENNGAFQFGGLHVIASDGLGWDHVSVSLPDRCPTWEEMCYINHLFFSAHEWATQFHPPKSKNINNHEFCLHMWRKQGCLAETPPPEMVGIAGVRAAECGGRG